MHALQLLLGTLTTVATTATAGESILCTPFPSSMIHFTSNFVQPLPPLIKQEFTTSFIQHKWDQNLSHITTGYITNSPTQNFVRVEEAFDGNHASSFFNYDNVTENGLVDNTLTTYSGNATEPVVWRGYVNSNFPVFQGDFLIQTSAVFSGLIHRQLIAEHVAAWSIMYQGTIPVTVYVDNCNVVIGYDYFSPGRRTGVVTEFFNIQARG